MVRSSFSFVTVKLKADVTLSAPQPNIYNMHNYVENLKKLISFTFMQRNSYMCETVRIAVCEYLEVSRII